MCGISGIVNLNRTNVKEEDIQHMISNMKNRGPDDEGIFTDKNVGFGFVRLSILDLSHAGHQPMFSYDDNFVIVFNGEIFNYIELRQVLEQKGYQFKTNTDTEVLLNAYIEWGKDCMFRLNGMWAFAIYNKKDKSIFIARDRYGMKPLFYYESPEKFIFASDIQALVGIIPKSKPNYHIISDYLLHNRTDQSEDTFFDNIKRLPHGYCIEIKNNIVSKSKWYDLKHNIQEPFGSVEEYLDTFKSAVSIRMRSDVPVGVCLSGGLDSSSIVSTLLADGGYDSLQTFSAIYSKGQIGDESQFINMYKDQVPNMHFVTPTSTSLLEDIEKFVRTHSEPIPSTSPYAEFKVMELAKKHVTVILDGQGADEQLAGYHYFFGFYFKDLIKSGKLLLASNEMFKYFQKHQSIFAFKTLAYFYLNSNLKNKFRSNRLNYLTSDFSNITTTNENINALFNSNSLKESLINHFEYKLEHALKWNDKNSMYHSVELRGPFLDHRLVEKTIPLPSEDIIKDGVTKQILRESMKGILPEQIRVRKDKVGFSTPEDEWFRTAKFKELIYSIINSESFANRKIIKPEIAQKLYQNHLSKKINISKEIWKWINLEIWFRQYMD